MTSKELIERFYISINFGYEGIISFQNAINQRTARFLNAKQCAIEHCILIIEEINRISLKRDVKRVRIEIYQNLITELKQQ